LVRSDANAKHEGHVDRYLQQKIRDSLEWRGSENLMWQRIEAHLHSRQSPCQRGSAFYACEFFLALSILFGIGLLAIKIPVGIFPSSEAVVLEASLAKDVFNPGEPIPVDISVRAFRGSLRTSPEPPTIVIRNYKHGVDPVAECTIYGVLPPGFVLEPGTSIEQRVYVTAPGNPGWYALDFKMKLLRGDEIIVASSPEASFFVRSPEREVWGY